MKKIFLVMIMFAGISAIADQTPIPDDQLASYKKAVNMAMHQSGPKNCRNLVGSNSGNVQNLIESATSASIDVDGAQPLLVFTIPSSTEKTDVLVTTTTDFKNIVSEKVEDFVISEMNSGDLRNPVITTGYKLTGAWICSVPGL